jgi:uncharacterized membrane-anchored protein YhcB (DUF1043 family)
MELEFPSWKELMEKKRLFDQSVDNQLSKKMKGSSDKHQIVSLAFETSVHILPSPFDAMAESIFESVEGYGKEKLREVRKFLDVIKARGEDHFNELAPALGRITHDIITLNNSTARRSTLLYVRDIIISKGDTIDQKLHKLTRVQEELSKLRTSQWPADDYVTSKESDSGQ